jgi:hypothetical protein
MTLAFDAYGKSRHFHYPHTPILVREPVSRLNCSSLSLRPVDLFASLVGADQGCPQPTEAFTSGLSTDWSPAPPPDITTVATGQVPPAGSTPARTTTSIAAPVRRVFPGTASRPEFQTGPSQRLVCHRPSYSLLPPLLPALCPGRCACEHLRASGFPLYPRGPRSGPGYVVPVRLHLNGPIRPTRGHIQTSPSRGLYQMPSLCLFA